ncbi:EAL domain-containing protein [Sphingomonas azotifigens]|uniref:EAL domain-containing protein n=1 Tax=Sphingomonas azotifigens TaxID=330920 RepID=UPI000A05C73F|nr:EAL domain-containing protein [Sphingomonas azotifigens]
MSIGVKQGCACDVATISASLGEFSVPYTACAEIVNVSFTISICNIDDILKAYGVVSADRVAQAVSSVIFRLNGSGAAAVAAGHQIQVTFPQDRLPEADSLAQACEAWIRHVCRSVALIPFWTEWGVVHVWLSAQWSAQVNGVEECGGDGLLGFSGDSVPDPGEGAARYRRDMAVASKLLCVLARAGAGGLDGGALRIVWQPVVARASCEVLYYQSTVRFEEAIGDPWLARNALAVVERVGFGGIIDEIVVEATVAELQADPTVMLSASISSVGVVCSSWWARLARRLEQEPEIAARLVLEISETAALARSAEVGRFCDKARRLGCKIAISDFGAGFASVRQLVAIGPDIVKIDCGFVRRSMTSPRDRAVLAGLRQLAAAVARIVVADGVDTFAHAQLTDELGLAWQQGHFWGSASTCRPWCAARAPVPPGPALLAG